MLQENLAGVRLLLHEPLIHPIHVFIGGEENHHISQPFPAYALQKSGNGTYTGFPVPVPDGYGGKPYLQLLLPEGRGDGHGVILIPAS
ncbi:hypothetical protein D3C76_1572520 [compost metagenome]